MCIIIPISTSNHIETDFNNNSGDSISPDPAALHGPIEIDGNAELDAFCAGNNTDGLSWATAHVIENYTISVVTEICINLNATTRYLILRNTTVTKTSGIDATVNIMGCSNILIDNFTLYGNNNWGFAFTGVENVVVSNCNFLGSDNAIAMDLSLNITVESSLFKGVKFNGMYIENSKDITIDQCNIVPGTALTVNNGFTIRENVTNIQILNSTTEQKYSGIDIEGSYGSTDVKNVLIKNVTIHEGARNGLNVKNVQGFALINCSIDYDSNPAVYMRSVVDGIIDYNIFGSVGINVEDGELENITFGDDNLVNNKPLKAFTDVESVNMVVGDVGQLILINVSNSVFNRPEISGSYNGIQVLDSNNISIEEPSVNYTSRYVISLRQCEDISINNGEFHSSNGISVKNVLGFESQGNLINLSHSGYGLYISGCTDVEMSHNIISNCSTGLEIQGSNNVFARNNIFTDCEEVNFQSTYEIDWDDSNTVNEQLLNVWDRLENQSLTISQELYALYIINCHHLIITQVHIPAIHFPVYISNSTYIEFRNFSFAGEFDNEAMSFNDCEYINILNSTFTDIDSKALEFSGDTSNVTISHCFFNNVSECMSGGSIYNLTVTENWFYNCSYGIEIEDDVTGEIFRNNYDSFEWGGLGPEEIMGEENFNGTTYDPDAFGPIIFTDDFLIFSPSPDPNPSSNNWIFPLIFWSVVTCLTIGIFMLFNKDILYIDDEKKIQLKRKEK